MAHAGIARRLGHERDASLGYCQAAKFSSVQSGPWFEGDRRRAARSDRRSWIRRAAPRSLHRLVVAREFQPAAASARARARGGASSSCRPSATMAAIILKPQPMSKLDGKAHRCRAQPRFRRRTKRRPMSQRADGTDVLSHSRAPAHRRKVGHKLIDPGKNIAMFRAHEWPRRLAALGVDHERWPPLPKYGGYLKKTTDARSRLGQAQESHSTTDNRARSPVAIN